MGILYDDVVIIRESEKEGDPSVITVNCPDKTGLGCDLCRILLFFGLSIVRGGNFYSLSNSLLLTRKIPYQLRVFDFFFFFCILLLQHHEGKINFQ